MEFTKNEKKKYYYGKYIKYKQKYLNYMKLLGNIKGGNSDSIISIILNQDRKSLEFRNRKINEAKNKYTDPFFKPKIIDIDKELLEKEKKYKEWELEFPIIKEALDLKAENEYLIQIRGGIHLAMDFDEILKRIKNKLFNLRKNKLLITGEEFEELDKSKWLLKGKDLSRIWGAEYLKNMFRRDKNSNFSTPEYIIVVDDLYDIRVKINTPADGLPCVNSIESGLIYATKIIGVRMADDSVVKNTLEKYGYYDFKDIGNVLMNSDGKTTYYVVDTEIKSFDLKLPYPLEEYRDLLEYLRKRFIVINSQDFLEYDDSGFIIRITINE
jgi:hypothetical protein